MPELDTLWVVVSQGGPNGKEAEHGVYTIVCRIAMRIQMHFHNFSINETACPPFTTWYL